MTKIWKAKVNISPDPSPSPGIGLKRHTFNIKHYLHKSYIHKSTLKVHFSLHSNNETTQKKTISRG